MLENEITGTWTICSVRYSNDLEVAFFVIKKARKGKGFLHRR
jgi:hypothetical protein